MRPQHTALKKDSEQTGARPENPLPRQHQSRPGIESNMDPRAQAVTKTVEDLGRLDILVNNAAYQHHQKFDR